MENEIAVAGEVNHPLTANAVVARARLIQEVMQKIMKEDTHYGLIPGCPKKSLWKPGAEQLLVTFRIAPDEPKVEDLSTLDCIRYRVTRTGRSNGQAVASGIGECSSDEEKYKWRKPVHDNEFDATPEDRKRLKFKRDGSSDKQVRTNPADVANTILKMADKRALISMTLLATGASDIFSQDLDDLAPEVVEAVISGEDMKVQKPKRTSDAKSGCQITFVPDAVSVKEGVGKKGPWKKFGVKTPDGKWLGTFDNNFGEMAAKAKELNESITVEYKIDGEYLTIVSMDIAAPATEGDAQI